MIKEEAIEILSDMRAEYNIFSDDEEEATRYHALSWAIQAINEKQRTGRWIPVTERLPKDGDEVLITAWKDTVFISWRSDGIWTCDSFFFDDSTEVSAWMPLPEPYKEVEE